MRCAELELVAGALVGEAVPGVAEAAVVAEDGERAGVASVERALGVGVSLGVVDEDARFVGRARVLDAVEDEVGAAELLDVLELGQLQRGAGDGGHGRGGWVEADATA